MKTNKPVQAQNVPTPTERPRRQIAHEEIARRAEQLWHDRGRPHGHDQAIWLEAESELQAKAESQPVAGTASRPYVDEPAKPLRANTKSRDPAEAGAQIRSATEGTAPRSGHKLRNQ